MITGTFMFDARFLASCVESSMLPESCRAMPVMRLSPDTLGQLGALATRGIVFSVNLYHLPVVSVTLSSLV
jgi:hypothetical protein